MNVNYQYYKKNGFILFENLLKKKDIIFLKKRLNYLEKNQKKGRGLSEPGVRKSLIHSVHKDEILKNLIEKKEWFQNISKKLLLTDEIYSWNAKSNLKKKWCGSAEYYHQDWIYWKDLGFKLSNMLSCMVFVDDHSHQNGGLWVFPKSHKKLYPHDKFLNINSLQKYLINSKILTQLNKKNKAISIKAEAGSCLFFNSKLVHGSGHNISPENRNILLYNITSKENINSAKRDKIQSFNRKERINYELKELKERISNL